jgi:hypothetical protein
MHKQDPEVEASLRRVEGPGCPCHNPFGRSFLRCGYRLELLPNRGQIGKALGTASHMSLKLGETHASWLSLQVRREILGGGMVRSLLLGASEENPQQADLPEASLAYWAGSEMAHHYRIPEHSVPELRELFVGEMDIRHRSTLIEKTTTAVRFLHGRLRGVAPTWEQLPKVLFQTLSEALLGPAEGDADIVDSHLKPLGDCAVLKLLIIAELEQFLITSPKALSTGGHRMALFGQFSDCQGAGRVVWQIQRGSIPISFPFRRPILNWLLGPAGRSKNILGQARHHDDHVGIQRSLAAPLPDSTEVILLESQEDLLKGVGGIILGETEPSAKNPPYHAGEALDSLLPRLRIPRQDALDELSILVSRSHRRLRDE